MLSIYHNVHQITITIIHGPLTQCGPTLSRRSVASSGSRTVFATLRGCRAHAVAMTPGSWGGGGGRGGLDIDIFFSRNIFNNSAVIIAQWHPVVMLLVEFYSKFLVSFRIKSQTLRYSFVAKYHYLPLIYPSEVIQRPEASQLRHISHKQFRKKLYE